MGSNFGQPEMPNRPTREKPPGVTIVKSPKHDEKEQLLRRARENDKSGWRRFLPPSIRRHIPQHR